MRGEGTCKAAVVSVHPAVSPRLGLQYYCASPAAILISGDMDTQIRPGRQPRRSKRLVLSIPVHVFGQDVFTESFNEFTHMVSVSAHGGALALAARVQKGQRILLVNKSTGQEQECRVVYVGSVQEGKWTVGIELVDPLPNFWKVNFPTCTPKPQLTHR